LPISHIQEFAGGLEVEFAGVAAVGLRDIDRRHRPVASSILKIAMLSWPRLLS
jgi:hypothetical protein